MLVSTKGRYALRVMIDIAENSGGKFVPMKEVSVRQEISQKYMEKIMPALVSHNMVEAVHGKGGGYRLTREEQSYSVGEILRATEGKVAPVACLGCDENECSRKEKCQTLPMWKELDRIINNYFDSVKLTDLMKK